MAHFKCCFCNTVQEAEPLPKSQVKWASSSLQRHRPAVSDPELDQDNDVDGLDSVLLRNREY